MKYYLDIIVKRMTEEHKEDVVKYHKSTMLKTRLELISNR